MKIKLKTSPIFIILTGIILVDNGIFTYISLPIISDSVKYTSLVAMAAVLLFINCVANSTISKVLKPYQNSINIYLIIITLFIAIVSIYSYIKYGQTLKDYFLTCRFFLYLFLISPILFIFCKENGYEDLVKTITAVVIIFLLLDLAAAVIYNFTGITVFNAIPFRVRHDRLRIFAPSLFGIAVSYSVFRLFRDKRQLDKLKWVAVLLIIIVYTFYTNMARMYIISILATVLVMYLVRPRAKTNQVIIWFILIVAAVILVESGVVDAFLETFSEDNEELGSSTVARQEAIEYFKQWSNANPIFSMAFVNPTNSYYYAIFFGPDGVCCFDDIGIINMWYHFGIFGVIVAAAMFIRLTYLYIKIYYINRSPNRVFIAGLFVFLLVTQVSLSVFDGQRIFFLVLLWAIFEYEAKTTQVKKTKNVLKFTDRIKNRINRKNAKSPAVKTNEIHTNTK